MNHPIPIYLLSGFLGSGKTTLLKQLLDDLKEKGKKPAVIMNEIGDVNIDGHLVDANIPMEEMLSGCICCTISGDLGMTILNLCRDHQPDVIVIESTGVANPIEIINSVTEASLLVKVQLESLITVVDGFYLNELISKTRGKTLRLMEDQIRCAGLLLINKADKLEKRQMIELEQYVRHLNPYSPIIETVHCQGALGLLRRMDNPFQMINADKQEHLNDKSCSGEYNAHNHNCSHHDHDDHHEHHVHHDHHDHLESHTHYHSYDHVMVYTHYYSGPMQRESFEEMIRTLPVEVYRAKGLVRFLDGKLYLFQYAYRELELLAIAPQASVPEVAVFIGENFSRAEVESAAAGVCG
ncbi:GTP-binding protein [Paenibacillus alkaliterrae]|uniref:CobW family GTP-binding protein n=1 Tax=Paenibacillus alkaliterrae TaxID=320909 RepID=UPI001F3FE660|nr:GTP-binding protein [Paenibacillus alkaliterrae]MCF2940325.1 GTP-binding protein [Paenibacillus alkaliterrae]